MITQNAVIRSADITMERGYLTAWLVVDIAVGSQGFGGFALHVMGDKYDFKSTQGHCGHYLMRLMSVVGVSEFTKLEGKAVRIKGDDTKIQSIGNFVKDEWFTPAEDFKK